MELDLTAVGAYLGRRFGAPAEIVQVAPLGPTDAAAVGEPAPHRFKTQGYGKPLLIYFRADGRDRRVVLRTMAPNIFGHERRADRAAGMILCFDTFNDLPRHVRALDVGAIGADGSLASLGQGELFLLTDYAPGTLYADDLARLRDTGLAGPADLERARALARYLADIHALRRADPALYRRQLRDVFGGGEGVAGLIDSYPADYPLAPPAWLESVERRLVAWRARLKAHPERLAQIHGDFHPFNVLFDAGDGLTLLDRSRGPWGEPADDVSAMAINYLFFSLQRSHTLAPPFDALWETFWQTYLARSGDAAMLEAAPPFFVWRALVVASPLWYQIDDVVRRKLFRFVDRMLGLEVFDPQAVEMYLR